GPHGVRKQAQSADHLGLNKSIPATCFPTAATMANSWDEQLLEEVGSALGEEAVDLNVNVLLGPGINMKRNPLCGRNFEYFSEDPYLAGKLAAGMIRGIQSNGIAACVKHFAANNQEERRMVIDTIVDERTLREIYLTAFEIAVKEGHTKAIMSSYNRLNGLHVNENPHLLREILREEWGFDGVVVSDWGGNNDRVSGLLCSNDLEMPGVQGESDLQVAEAVRDGRISAEVLDESVDRLLSLVCDTSKDLEETEKQRAEIIRNPIDHHKLARKAAEESIVLLKNEDRILPLEAGTKVALIGDFAQVPRYQGAGSSIVNPTRLDTTVELIGDTDLECVGFAPGYQRGGGKNEALGKEAVDLARKAEVVLLYLGLDETSEVEGLDRSHMRIPENQTALLRRLFLANERIVVILSCGSAIEMSWIDKACAVVHGYLGGQAGAKAMLNVIEGKVNPSGRLAESYPYSYKDVPSATHFPGKEVSVEYREGLFIGYRYYTSAEVLVQFPFGYGLSYTTFAYDNLKVTGSEVSFDVKNTGGMTGAEVAQVYITARDSAIFRAKRELKGFAKVRLNPGEKRRVTVTLDDKAFRFYNTEKMQWDVEAGEYEIQVGKSCEDIRLHDCVEIEGSRLEEMKCEPYDTGAVADVSRREFQNLLGRQVPAPEWDRSKPLSYNDTLSQMQYAKGWMARFVYHLMKLIYKVSKKLGKTMVVNMFDMVVFHMPFRGINKMSGGAFSAEMVDGLLVAVNGHFFRGMGMIRRASKEKKEKMKG
ncbi:MAG: glycoside hydrolase family 3 C-terminal domain-containing protein, partial [Hespellia sp.]|nr:glycoside hydrolase family 3 C-terminal domain-containing protein [Hespellia sp.]